MEWHRGFQGVGELQEIGAVSHQSIAKPWFIDKPDVLAYWQETLRLLICVVKPDEGQSTVKEVPSTEGMQLSV